MIYKLNGIVLKKEYNSEDCFVRTFAGIKISLIGEKKEADALVAYILKAYHDVSEQ